ncbi:MAG: alpha/beta hydrolase [Alphaproteobacteria bacterium]|jgi:lysophospholipase|nr:alpha/beta hydrolase [Alphaproteobacteria bacterium]
MTFIRVSGNLEPDGAEELWLEGRGGVKLRAMLAPALNGPPRGSVLLCNGRTEFIEKYFEVVSELQARGFVVFSMDWRGQGLSSRLTPNPQKGHLETLDDPANDLGDAVRTLAAQLPKPHLILAHSMGGAIALRAMQMRRVEVEAAAFSAPMWGIPDLKDMTLKFVRFMAAAGFGATFAPGVERQWRKEKFKANRVTHDAERFARAQAAVEIEPRLALAGPTVGWVNAAAEAFENFRRPSALANIRVPILVASAGEEKLVDNESHEDLAKLMANARHITVEGAMHEILMERDDKRAEFWAAFDALAAQAAPARAIA